MNGPEENEGPGWEQQLETERRQYDQWLAEDAEYLAWLKQFDREEE